MQQLRCKAADMYGTADMYDTTARQQKSKKLVMIVHGVQGIVPLQLASVPCMCWCAGERSALGPVLGAL